MAKGKAGKKKPQKQKRSKAIVVNRPRKAGQGMGMAVPTARAWLQLLADPCSAPLVPPCYGGMDGGYLIRTVDNIILNGATVGLTVGKLKCDFSFELSPWNYSSTTGIKLLILPSTWANGVFTDTGPANFITASGSVKEYRPVACCAKFIPTGEYATRSGVVGRTYNTGVTMPPSGTANVSAIINEMSGMQRIDPCGSVQHEVKWVPTQTDMEFTTVTAPNRAGAGSVRIIGVGVDGVATSATAYSVNGYVEITTVWEWTPVLLSGVTPSLRQPSPYTAQQVLSTIRNLGDFFYEAQHSVGRLIGGVKPFVKAGSMLLSGGVGTSAMRGAAMIMG